MKSSISKFAIYFLLGTLSCQVRAKSNYVTAVNWKNCTSDADCTSIPDSFCDPNVRQECGIKVCNCKSTHVGFADTTNNNALVCLPKTGAIGEACSADIQCSAFGQSTCVQGACQCTPPARERNGVCVTVKNLGEICSSDNECDEGKGAICSLETSRCSCYDWRLGVEVPGKPNECAQAAQKLGDSCSVTPDQCHRTLQNAFCDPSTKTCQCDNSTHVPKLVPGPDPVHCVPKQFLLYGPCEQDDQCVVANTECSDYLGKVCDCKSRFTYGIFAENTCLPLATIEDNSCLEDIQCSKSDKWSGTGRGSECVNGKCQCKQGYLYINTVSAEFGVCYPPASLGVNFCYFDEQCYDDLGSNAFTKCETYLCDCSDDATQVRENGKKMCIKNRKLGDSCESSVDCKAISGGVICSENKCKCDQGYKSDETNTKCLIGTST